MFCTSVGNRDKSFNTVTMGWTTEKLEFDSRPGQRTFVLSTASRPPLGPHPNSTEFFPREVNG